MHVYLKYSGVVGSVANVLYFINAVRVQALKKKVIKITCLLTRSLFGDHFPNVLHDSRS